ncbi:MAG TPA: hypothetical protein DIW47_11280 [Bacteroidetes bacterium]|nr:hypothetical protein [Bacteroidota bacterium]
MFGDSIYLGSLRFDELSSFLTDTLVALIAAFAAYKLAKIPGEAGGKKLLLIHFICLALATFLGGLLGHSLLYATGLYGKLPGWLFSIASVFALEIFVLRIGAGVVKQRAHTFSYALSAAMVVSCTILTIISLKFVGVMLHTVYGLLFLTGIFGIILIRKKSFARTFQWFWAGIGATLLAGLIFVMDLSPTELLSSMDLSHLFLGLSTWFFYLGGKNFLLETSHS